MELLALKGSEKIRKKNRLIEHTGVKYPIICGAMYPCSNPELVAAAANGGGMSIIPGLSYNGSWI